MNPNQLSPLQVQVAGHGNLLHYPPDRVLKPFSATEHSFYLNAPTSLKPFMLPIFGTLTYESQEYLVMQDATASFKRPCVADIKIGTRQYGLDVPEEKRKKQDAKCLQTTSCTLGLRLCGWRVWNNKDKAYNVTGKYQHRSVTDDDVPAALSAFFYDGTGVLSDVAHDVADQIKKLIEIMADIKGLRLWGSSLLVVYEGDDMRRSQVYLIDFNHSYVSNDQIDPTSEDKGYIFGLKNLYNALCLVKEEEWS